MAEDITLFCMALVLALAFILVNVLSPTSTLLRLLSIVAATWCFVIAFLAMLEMVKVAL